MLDKLKELLTGQAPIRECLGLYISPEGMVLCEASLAGPGKPKMGAWAAVPMPPNLGAAKMGTLNTELLEKTDQLAEALKGALSKGNWSAKNLVITLSPHFGLTRYFIMPQVAWEFYWQAVPLEAKKYIPFPFGDLAYDFQVQPLAPGADKKTRMGVLFAITPQKNVANLRSLAEKLGKELAAVELATLSTSRLWRGVLADAGGESAQAEVQFDPQATYVVVHRRGLPLLSREVYWAAGQEVDRRRIDLNGCVDFVRKQFGAQEVRVRVMGAANLEEWQKTFQGDLNLPVQAVDLSSVLGLTGLNWSAVAALGASLRFVLPAGSVADVSQAVQKSQGDNRVVFDLWAASGLFSGFFLLLGVFCQAQILWKARSLSEVSRQSGGIPDFQGKTADQIQTLMAGLKSQVSSLGTLAGPRKHVVDVLAWVADNIPEAAWLTDINYDDGRPAAAGFEVGPSFGAAPSSGSLVLTGMVAASGAAEEIQIVNLFRDNLKRDKRFAAHFSTIDLLLNRGNEGGSSRTVFTLTCRKGGK